MNPSGKRTRSTSSSQENGKRVRTGSKDEPSSSTAVPTSSRLEPAQEKFSLPVQSILCKTILDTLKVLEHHFEIDENSVIEYPVFIGSRAAAFWLPSFRPFSDWDLIATPRQAYRMVKDLEAYEKNNENSLSISLIKQPLNPKIVKRKPLTSDIQEKLKSLPSNLLKVCGAIKGVMNFQIEIAPVTSQLRGIKAKKGKHNSVIPFSSAGQILSMCNSSDSISRTFLNFPISDNNTHQCLVASIEILETLKSSHINWPDHFTKHIADLHSLRALLHSDPSSCTNIGIRADKSKPLTSPERTPELEDFLLTRTIETEAFHGTPGAHSSLKELNEDSLGCDNDLFVTHHIPHDDVHDLVKYGDTPIYDQLKTNSAKVMVSRALFEEAPYDTQIKCVKEEAMVIALERYLLPNLSGNPSSAYKSALIRICTTLTKDWFRQFSVDNYPRLVICDKNLLSIRDEILSRHPLPPEARHDPLDILKTSIENLDDLVTVQKLLSLTRRTTLEQTKRLIKNGNEESDSVNDDSLANQKQPLHKSYNKVEPEFWTIRSDTQNQSSLLVSFINECHYGSQYDSQTYHFFATLSVQTITKNTKLNGLQAFVRDKKDYRLRKTNQNIYKIAVLVYVETSGGFDMWIMPEVHFKSLENEVKVLNVEGLTEDLLMKFIVSVVQPKLHSTGEKHLLNYVNSAKSKGLISLTPKHHPWFDLWKYGSRL